MAKKKLISIGEAAEILGKTKRTVDRYVERGFLKKYKSEVNGRVGFDPEHVHALAERLYEFGDDASA